MPSPGPTIPWVRPPAVAGSFYPADPAELRAAVGQMLEDKAKSGMAGETEAPPKPSISIKAIIAPHAGYVFSGPVAATAYRTLIPSGGRGQFSRVVLIGPSHRVAFAGIASSTATHFATPLGDVPLDHPAIAALSDLPFFTLRDDAHAREHGIEVHLPFLIETIGGFNLVPLVVGDASTQQVAQILDRLWGGGETLIVISSDLSHYHPYDAAVRLDAAAARAIEDLRPLDLAAEQACGCVPIRGLLSLAARHHLRPQTLDLRNSADTAPQLAGRDQVVGYGAWVFAEEEKSPGPGPKGQGEEKKDSADTASVSSSLGPRPSALSPSSSLPQASSLKPQAFLPDSHRQTLLALARRSISHGLTTGRPLPIDLDHYDSLFRQPRAAFVTLNLPDGNLRGCIGTLEARRPLVEDIAQNAFAAAFRDPRFPPVTAAELPALQIHLSLLTAPQPMTFASEADLIAQLLPGVDGLILEEPAARRRGTFLPAVWETLPNPREFLNHLKQKAGLPADYWSPTLLVYRYEAESIGPE